MIITRNKVTFTCRFCKQTFDFGVISVVPNSGTITGINVDKTNEIGTINLLGRSVTGCNSCLTILNKKVIERQNKISDFIEKGDLSK